MVVFVAFIFVIVYFYFTSKHYKQKTIELSEKTIIQKALNDSLKKSNENLVESGKVTDEIINKTVDKIIESEDKEAYIKDALQSKLEDIGAINKSDSDEERIAKEAARSKAYMDTLWKQYCIAVNGNDISCLDNILVGENND